LSKCKTKGEQRSIWPLQLNRGNGSSAVSIEYAASGPAVRKTDADADVPHHAAATGP
jgi:hypothetical protein